VKGQVLKGADYFLASENGSKNFKEKEKRDTFNLAFL
jgi:hypothetical protein